MAIDPKAAAAAAQAAAEAAKAAAAEAAREAAIAAAKAEAGGDATGPTLADSGARQVLEDTEATGAGEGQLDGTSMASVTDRDLNLLSGSARESLVELPGLEASASSPTQGGVASPFDLGSSFQSNQSPGFGRDSISTVFRVNMDTDDAELVNVKQPEEEWTRWPTDSESTGGTGGGGTDDEEWERWPEATGGSEGGSTDDGSDSGQAPNPSPLDPIISGDPPAEEEEDDDEIVVQADSTAGGSTSVARPAPDEYGGYTGSWSGITPVGPGSDDDDIVAGATGNTGSGTGGVLGPQGGSWAINPGDEFVVADRETSLRDAREFYGGLTQPLPVNDEVAGDPSMLQQPMGPDETVINPERSSSGETADAEVQASTAYRTMAAPAGGTSPSADDGLAGGIGEEQAAGSGIPDDLADGGSSFDDPTAAMAPVSEDDDAGHGQGRGREFGQSQGRGQGQDKDDDSDLSE